MIITGTTHRVTRVADMARSDFLSAHQEIWNWLARHPNKERWHWPGWLLYNIDGDISYCFACTWSKLRYEATLETDCDEASDFLPRDMCKNCLLEWPNHDLIAQQGGQPCNRDYGCFFYEWRQSFTLEYRTRLAEQIRDLPARGE